MTVFYVVAAFILGSVFTVLVRRKQRACVHHNRSTGGTWLTGYLVDYGMGKIWYCRECGQTWKT